MKEKEKCDWCYQEVKEHARIHQGKPVCKTCAETFLVMDL